jgi:hypothetical protein
MSQSRIERATQRVGVVAGVCLLLCGASAGTGRAQGPARSFELLEATVPELQRDWRRAR